MLYFRYHKHELRHLNYLSPDLDSGNICPACPKVCIVILHRQDKVPRYNLLILFNLN